MGYKEESWVEEKSLVNCAETLVIFEVTQAEQSLNVSQLRFVKYICGSDNVLHTEW